MTTPTTLNLKDLSFIPPHDLSFTSLPRDAVVDSVDANHPIRRSSRQVHKAFWTNVEPEKVADPVILLSTSPAALQELGWDQESITSNSNEFAQIMAGNKLLPNSLPYAHAYAGHQFGVFAGQLGDGRAITLGEVNHVNRWELQLKGAGRTPYSRFADGYAVLRSSIREYIASEYFARVGIPTTRALSLVLTPSRAVAREIMEPGAIVCRMAPSWTRIGTVELPFYRQWPEGITMLLNHVIERDFPHLGTDMSKETYLKWFGEVVERNARLVAKWQAHGWTHGVMNTDNTSLLGLTIDYGPYAWLDDYNPDYTPNHTDEGGRYTFANQPGIMLWNLTKLGRALFGILPDQAEAIKQKLEAFKDYFLPQWRDEYAKKLGISDPKDQDISAIIHPILNLLHQDKMDYNNFFRNLSEYSLDDASSFSSQFQPDSIPQAKEWFITYSNRVKDNPTRRQDMRRVNPKWVPRQWILQDLIDTCHASPLSNIDDGMSQRPEPRLDSNGNYILDASLSIIDSAMRVLLHDTYGEISEDGQTPLKGWGMQEWMLIEKWSNPPPSQHRNLMCSCSS